FIRQIGALADEPDLEPGATPPLANARIEYRCFLARIGANDDQPVGVVDPRNGGIEQVAGASPFGIKRRAVLPAIEIDRAQPPHKVFEGEHVLDGGEIARNRADPLALGNLELRRDGMKRFAPGRRPQSPALAQIWLIEALHAQAVDLMSGLVGNPLL